MKIRNMSRRWLIVAGFALTGLVVAAPAHAQLGLSGGGATPSRLANTPQNTPNPVLPPPPAIPGVKTAPSPVAAPERPPSDMSPNDALFDAINRGDTPAARDALNRGADLSATNILGMTPLALSVDLGRDDISFILLSMRGAEPRRQPPPSQTASAAQPAGRPSRAVRVSTAAERPVRPPPAPPRTQFANETGTPQPSAGFLGFGPH